MNPAKERVVVLLEDTCFKGGHNMAPKVPQYETPCRLSDDDVRQFYNQSSRQWLITDEVLEAVSNDVQSIIECAQENDTLLFSTNSIVTPARTLYLSKNLTLGSQYEPNLVDDESQISASEVTRFTCPETEQLITSRSPSFTLLNIVVEGCHSSSSIIELDADCEGRSLERIRFRHVVIERNILTDEARILNSRAPMCFYLELDDVRIGHNLCTGDSCLFLSSRNALNNIHVIGNTRESNSSPDLSIFLAPEGSRIIATNITSRGNQMKSFYLSNGRLDIIDSNFSNNTWNHASMTRSNGVNGGVLFSINSTVSISHTIFEDNYAQIGGVICAPETSVSISRSNLTRNEAEFGGSLYLRDSNSINISHCSFIDNKADAYGGVIYMEKQSKVFFWSLEFHNNSAQYGGAIYVFTSSNGTIFNSNFTNNTASVDGGAINVQTNSFLELSNLVFSRNRASNGGAVFVFDSITLMESITFISNNALCGGALFSSNSTTNVTNSTFEANHVKEFGGAVYLKESNATFQNTIMHLNEAIEDCGGICAAEVSHLEARNFIVQSNFAGNEGGGIGIKNGSSILCYSCEISNNSANSGAGMHVYSNNTVPLVVQLQNSQFVNNSAKSYGGGMTFDAPADRSINCTSPSVICGQIVLLGTNFEGNFANWSGGAILSTHASRIFIDCEHNESKKDYISKKFNTSLKPIQPQLFCSSWTRNWISRNASGKVVGTYGQDTKLTIAPNDEIYFNGSSQTGYVLENVSGGKQLPNINIMVLDEFRAGPAPTKPRFFDARLFALDDFSNSTYTSTILDGSGHFFDVGVSARPGKYILQMEFDHPSLRTFNMTVIVRECLVGEEFNRELQACQKCDALSYNFNVLEGGNCTQCPNRGNCKGRFIVAKEGFWHKSPCHNTLQECLVEEACTFENRTDTLIDFASNFINCNINKSNTEAYNNKLCNKGYEGLLCGSCKQSFGLSLRFSCLECPRDILSLLTILCITIYLLAAASFTIRGCLPFNLESQKVPSLSKQSSNDVGLSNKDPELNIEMVTMLVEGYVPPSYFEKQRTKHNSHSQTQTQTQMDTSQQENEYELTRWRAAEILKIIINYLQTIAVAATIGVQWTDGVLGMFESSEYIGALTTVAISRPVDCIISSSSPALRAIWRQLVSLCVPMIVISSFIFFWSYVTIKNGKDWRYLLKRCSLSAISVVYISYLGLTRMAVRAFYCINIYDSDDYSINSKHKFWAIDTSIRCYGKDHFGIISIGAFTLVVVTIFFPSFFGILLSRKKESLRRRDSWTFETAGFLFRAFKEKFAYWESVVMFRKACLSIIVVFSYPLGGDSQGLLASILLFFCLYMQLTLKPYREEFKILNQFESISLLVSSLTFTLGQFFAHDRCNDSARTFLAILIIFGNSLFFSFLLLALFYNSMVHLRVILQCENIPLPNPPTWWNIVKVYIYCKLNQWLQSLFE
eukprot:g3786.t1